MFLLPCNKPCRSLRGLIRRARSQGMDSKAMMAKIFDEVKVFSWDHPRSDDMTLTIIRTE